MKLLFLYLVLAMWVVFEIIPYDGTPLNIFPFSEYQLPFKTWLYFLFEHIGVIMLCYIIASEEIIYKQACKVFFWLQVLDLSDYILTYNTKWFTLFGIPITFNVISFVIFSLICVKEYGRGSS